MKPTEKKSTAAPASPPLPAEPAEPAAPAASPTREQKMAERWERKKAQNLAEPPAFTAQDWQDAFKAQDRAALEYNRERLLNQFPGLQLVLKPKA